VETFVVQLARVSKRGSRYLLGLQSADRDDVVASALLAAWTQRDDYDFNTPLDTWFSEHLRNARRAFKRAQKPTTSVEQLNELAAPDDVAYQVESMMATDTVYAALTVSERRIVSALALGYETPSPAVRSLRSKLRKLRDIMPERQEAARAPAEQVERDTPAPIDHEIEKLLRRGATTTADCPVCWRCCWFDGLAPSQYSPPHFAEAEVETAVRDTERRKIEIANGVRQ
jgi:hypothetical protein